MSDDTFWIGIFFYREWFWIGISSCPLIIQTIYSKLQVSSSAGVSRSTESKTRSALFFRNVVLCILPYGTTSMWSVPTFCWSSAHSVWSVSHSTGQIMSSLDEMLVNEALHQGLEMYSSRPIFPKFYIDGEFFGGQLQRATSLSAVRIVLWEICSV